MGWGSDLKDKVPHAKVPETQWRSGRQHQRLASRFYQLKTEHARTEQYLHWVKARPDAQCWWCKCPSQTRDYLFKVCPEWKMQRKILWMEVLKETKRWKSRWTVRDLLADGRCGRAVLDFLSSTDMGRLVPPLKEVGDAGSEVSKSDLWERWERQEEREGEAEALAAVGDGEKRPLFLPTPSFMALEGEE
jgi:hypothetical protein